MREALLAAASRLSAWLRVALVGWSAFLSGGCDERPRWRTIGCDAGRDAGTAKEAGSPRGGIADGLL